MGDRLVLMMDANKDVVDREMGRQLRNRDILVRGPMHSITGTKSPNTYFKGELAINGIWVTKDIEVTSVTYLPYDLELGDHRHVVANITKK